MRRLSLRRSLLTVIAGVLERWLGVVTARLEPESPYQPVDPRQPPPPDHWVELVRQHAPQLLDSESDGGDALLIDWRSDAAEVNTPSPVPPSVAQPRPLRFQQPQQPSPPRAPKREFTPKRSLRLEQVRTQALGADDVSVTPTTANAEPIPPEFVRTSERLVTTTVPIYPTDAPEQVESAMREQIAKPLPEQAAPPEVRTSVPEAAPLRQRRLFGLRLPSFSLLLRGGHAVPEVPKTPITPRPSADLPREAALREVPTAPVQADRLSAHFSGTSFERHHIRETQSSIPVQPRLADIRTEAGEAVPAHQQRTSIPAVPPQLVMRPAHVYPALNIEDITPDRWASLPESPPNDQTNDARAARYERLRREQEGRAWSE